MNHRRRYTLRNGAAAKPLNSEEWRTIEAELKALRDDEWPAYCASVLRGISGELADEYMFATDADIDAHAARCAAASPLPLHLVRRMMFGLRSAVLRLRSLNQGGRV